MTDLYDFTLSSVFAAYLNDEAAFLSLLRAFEGNVNPQRQGLAFTLPALFELARALHAEAGLGTVPGARVDYLRFRAAMYRSQTNSRLNALGGQVELATGHKDHDQSLYRLVRLALNA